MLYDKQTDIKDSLKKFKNAICSSITLVDELVYEDLVNREEIHNLYMCFADHMRYLRKILTHAENYK